MTDEEMTNIIKKSMQNVRESIKIDLINWMIKNPIIDDYRCIKDGVETELVALIEFVDCPFLAGCFNERFYTLKSCEPNTLVGRRMIICTDYTIGGDFYGIPTLEKVKEYNVKCTEEKDKIKKVYFADGTILSV